MKFIKTVAVNCRWNRFLHATGADAFELCKIAGKGKLRTIRLSSD
jgi:hypothetical protein